VALNLALLASISGTYKTRSIILSLGILIIFPVISSCAKEPIKANIRPQKFVDIKQEIPNISFDIRYATHFNFVGDPIDGYQEPKCLLTRETADALKQVQNELIKNKFSLKIYDCYRPQSAVNHFIRWAKDLEDTRMKNIFYPYVDKKDLFKQGYIAAKSGHSRGSTLDTTIVPIPVDNLNPYTYDKPYRDNSIPMGSPFDFFDPLSHTDSPQINCESKNNRQLLKEIMEKYGFQNLPEEWWHYTLRAEPYPETYFNFPVE
jgi:D-alanyl-D-alanine dipeptidase